MFSFSIITKVSQGKIRKRDAITLNEYLGSFIGDLEIILRPPKKQGTNPQNKYYWGVIINILSQELGYNREEMHDVLKSIHGFKDHKEIVDKDGVVTDIEFIRGYSSYTTKEREDYHETIRRWASDLGINIPEPNER